MARAALTRCIDDGLGVLVHWSDPGRRHRQRPAPAVPASAPWWRRPAAGRGPGV